ncbi:MAG: hypothetical protein KBE16_00395 [Alphaproteobacteria bacterium]|nr:hypothetical protein [Alphaproteobacteria bacterium]
MDWKSYNVTLQPLIKKFGSFKYTTQYISSNYFYWKDKPQSELLELVNECISFNQQLDLKPATNKEIHLNSTQQYIKHMDNLTITEGYLDQLLKDNDCSSVKELVLKNVKITNQ